MYIKPLSYGIRRVNLNTGEKEEFRIAMPEKDAKKWAKQLNLSVARSPMFRHFRYNVFAYEA